MDDPIKLYWDTALVVSPFFLWCTPGRFVRSPAGGMRKGGMGHEEGTVRYEPQ